MSENFAIKAYIARNSTAIAQIYNAEGEIFRREMQVHELISISLDHGSSFELFNLRFTQAQLVLKDGISVLAE
jgi:hypothetical protein